MVILSSQIMFQGRLRITGFMFKMTNLGAIKSQFKSFNQSLLPFILFC